MLHRRNDDNAHGRTFDLLRPTLGQVEPSIAPAASAVEGVAQSACEGFGLAGVPELAAEEAAVMAREHGRLLAQ
jgi:hypothetical protein